MNTVQNSQEDYVPTKDDKIFMLFSGVTLAIIFGYLGGLV